MATAKKAQPKKAPPKTPATLELWNKVCVTDPRYTKRADTRGGFTSINATWQAWQATELWGPYGKNWGVKELRYDFLGNPPVGATLWAIFYCPEAEFEIGTDMPYKPNDDCWKKLLTDLTTKALSKLGFSADVFFGLYDDARYDAVGAYAAHRGAQQPAEAPKEQTPPPAKADPPPAATEPPQPPEGGAEGMFLNAFSLDGLRAAVVGRLFLDEKPLLKSFMPNEKSTKHARTLITDLVKLRMSEDASLGAGGEEITGMASEEFYQAFKSHLIDQIAAREG